MTRFLLSSILMAAIALALYWSISTFIPLMSGYAIPISLFLGIILGFYIYIKIDNRMGP